MTYQTINRAIDAARTSSDPLVRPAHQLHRDLIHATILAPAADEQSRWPDPDTTKQPHPANWQGGASHWLMCFV